jgi:hypothetical protein
MRKYIEEITVQKVWVLQDGQEPDDGNVHCSHVIKKEVVEDKSVSKFDDSKKIKE